MTNFPAMLRALQDAGVEFIVIGGLAATAHGSARSTLDLDVVYRRSPENLERLGAALQPHHPYLRGAPPGLPFLWDEATLKRGLNFTLITDLGALDVLGEVAGGGSYQALSPFCVTLELFGARCLCVNLPKLIELKRAAGRPKDLEAIAELERLREIQEETP